MRRQQYQLDQPLVRHQHSQNHDPSFWRPKAATPTSPRRATVRPSRNLGAISMGVATGRHNPPTFRRQLSSQTTSATDSEPIYTEIDDVILRRPIGRPQHVDYPAIPTSKPQPRPPVPAHPRMGRRAITQLDLKSRMPPPRECRPCLDPTAARPPLLPGAPCGSQSDTNDDVASVFTTDVVSIASGLEAAPISDVLKKGLLWAQRDKMFARWKERFFVLTKDYLQCFRKGSSPKLSEMGAFSFKIRLSDIESVELVDKRGYLTISMTLSKEGNSGKILLRKTEGIRTWFQMIKEWSERSKERRRLTKTTKEFWSRKQYTDSSSMEQWLQARKNIEAKYAYRPEQHHCNAAMNRKQLSRSNMNVSMTTTNYGFLDSPNYDSGLETRPSLSPPPVFTRVHHVDTVSTFSQDSGVDSMETPNTSGNTSCGAYKSPCYIPTANNMNRPFKSKIPTPTKNRYFHVK